MDDFKLKFEIRIDWSEIDLFGLIKNLERFSFISL